MVKAKINRRSVAWNDFVVIAFALTSIVLLGLEINGVVSANTVTWIKQFDIAIALFFGVEFFYRLSQQKRKARFFVLHSWELLAAIPVSSLLTQSLRGLRVFRGVEVLSIVRGTARLEKAGEIFGRLGAHPYLIQGVSTLLAIMFGSAIGFFAAEFGKNPNLHSLWDAFWWTAVTMTTTGYGDIYPVTTIGRILAMILMFTGLVSAVAFTAMVVRYLSWHKKR